MLVTNTAGLSAYAAAPGADVNEKLYINMDYYGGVEKASVVKEIQFATADSYTDYGTYSKVTNMTDNQVPSVNGDAVTWKHPDKGSRLYFQGDMEPDQISMPWSFDVTYKVNGVVTSPEKVGGSAGTIEIDIDAFPNKNVSEYMRNNMALMVLIPMDTQDVYSIDAPGSMEASVGNYSGIAFEALPGKEGNFVARFGTNCFESMGVMMFMSPVTVSDLNKVKDLKEIKDKFRDNTNAVMDSVDAIMDNVADMSVQMEKTNQVLDEIANGKKKLDENRTIIFNGVDLSLQDVRDLNALLDPVDTSLKTSQWMVYEINTNLNDTNTALMNTSGVMGTLNKKLRILSEEMATTNTFNIDSITNDLVTTKTALNSLKTNLVKGGTAVANIKTIMEDDDFENDSENLMYDYVTGESEYEEENLPQAVIEVINASLPEDKTAITAEMLDSQISNIAMLLDVYNVLHKSADTAHKYKITGTALSVMSSALPTALAQFASGDAAGAAATMGAALSGISEMSAYAADTGFITNLLTNAATLAAGPSQESLNSASRFIERMKSMLSMKKSLNTLSDSTSYGSAGTSLKTSLQTLSDSGTEALANAITAYSSTDYDELFTQIDQVMADIEDVMDAGATVSYQTSRLLDSLRKVTASVDKLTGTMNSYYEDIQTAITNMSNVIEQTEKLSTDLTGTIQTVNNTLRAATEDLSKAGDDAIDLGHEAVDNTNRIIENTKKMKEAGADLRKTINDELDEEEEDNNFLNMDPDATKESLTSGKNQEPASIRIICRTEEISAGSDSEEDAADAEFPTIATTLLGRVGNIFKTFWEKVTGLFAR